MSVRIKGMPMPGECRTCPLCRYYAATGWTFCMATKVKLAEGCKTVPFEGRHETCPMDEEPNDGEWIPFKTRPLTDDEKEDHPELDAILDCKLPDDGQAILISVDYKGKSYVLEDTYYDDGGESYLDSGYEIEVEATAWMPLPKPYKKGDVRQEGGEDGKS